MIRNIVEFFKLPESVRIPGIWGPAYRLAVKIDNKSILREKLPEHPLNTQERGTRIIASLTSYPARISYVHLAVKSLMLQTYKPDRIILWLAEEQFPTRELPKALTDLRKYGLEIVWMHDLYGHKKYFYPVLEQKDKEVVITFDDDIIYSPNAIKRLMKTHKKYPGCLVCERGQVYCEKEKNPGRWTVISNEGVQKPTFRMNPSPGGGCLIPKGAFHPDAVSEEKICSLAYKNDDLWYMFMCAANGTRTIKTRKYHKTFSVIDDSQGEQMATENVANERNNLIMEGLISAYPDAWRRIATGIE